LGMETHRSRGIESMVTRGCKGLTAMRIIVSVREASVPSGARFQPQEQHLKWAEGPADRPTGTAA
jgi:hypothetical protein